MPRLPAEGLPQHGGLPGQLLPAAVFAGRRGASAGHGGEFVHSAHAVADHGRFARSSTSPTSQRLNNARPTGVSAAAANAVACVSVGHGGRRVVRDTRRLSTCNAFCRGPLWAPHCSPPSIAICSRRQPNERAVQMDGDRGGCCGRRGSWAVGRPKRSGQTSHAHLPCSGS